MTNTSLRPRLLSMAPLVLLAHVVEEAPGLIPWMNRRFELDLTMRYFITMSALGLIVTVALAVPRVGSGDRFRALGLIAWLSFLMLANGVVHLTASLLFREYVPGTVTAGILYLPYFVAATVTICRNVGIQPGAAVLAATLGAVPMLVQGLSILTGGGRVLW
jgi:hypothetical protein